MAATLVAEDLNESIVEGFTRIDLVRTFQVITSSRTTSAFTVRRWAGVPRVGSIATMGTGEILWVTNAHPYRVETDATHKKWNIDVTYTNATGEFPRDVNGNPVENPTDAVKEVDLSYLEFQKKIDDALLVSITYGGKYGVGQTLQAPPWIIPQGTNEGPVTNSAMVPQEQYKSIFKRLITVSQWVDSWTDYDSYIGRVNLDQVTIQERDASGVKLEIVAEPHTLLLQNIIKENHWKDGRLYFRRRFVLAENKDTWLVSQLDEGMERYMAKDVQYKPDGSGDKVDQDYLDSLGIQTDFGYDPITTKDGQALISQPVRFNGWGSESPIDKASSYNGSVAHYLNYYVYRAINFSGLGL
jgi:hypothetical protein